jgi:hypothetical protein
MMRCWPLEGWNCTLHSRNARIVRMYIALHCVGRLPQICATAALGHRPNPRGNHARSATLNGIFLPLWNLVPRRIVTSLLSSFLLFKTQHYRNFTFIHITTMLRNAIRPFTTASSSLMRPVVARVVARPMVMQLKAPMDRVAKRGYHAKVIDHYENPRNVSWIMSSAHLSVYLVRCRFGRRRLRRPRRPFTFQTPRSHLFISLSLITFPYFISD